MFKRWYHKTSESAGLRNRLILLLLAAAIAAPVLGDTVAGPADKQPSGPNDVPRAGNHVQPMAGCEPNAPTEPNAPVDPDTATPDGLELSCGTTVCVKVVSVTLSIGGKERSWPRDVMRSLTLSRDGQAVLAVADAKQIPGILARVLVRSQAGMMAFDRDDVRAVALDAPPAKAGPLPADSPLLVQNLLLREASVEKLKEANQAALAACAQKYEKPLADAKAKVGAARQSHKLAKDAAARVSSDLAKREAEQTAYFQRYGRRDTQLGYTIRRLQEEHRAKANDKDTAAAKLKDAEAAHAALVKARTDEQRDMHRSLPAAIARVQTQAAKHEFIMHSGGDLSERAMQKAFDAVKIK